MRLEKSGKALVLLILLVFPGVVLANTPPDVMTTLGPTPLFDGKDAECTVYYSDPEGDLGEIQVNWSVNANQVGLRNFDDVNNDSTIVSTLDSSNYDDGDNMFCNATANDNDGDGDFGYEMDNIRVQTDPPNVTEGPKFFNYSSEHAFNVSAIVKDREGQEDMDWCRINVTDGEGNQLLDNMTFISSYGDDTQARCFYPDLSNYTSGFNVIENLSVMVWVNDSESDTGSKIDYNTIPNSPPVIYNVRPKDDSSTASPDVELETNVMDYDGERINVSFYNNSGTKPQLHFEPDVITGGYTSYTWNDLDSLKTFHWYINATDGHQTTIKKLRFRNLISSQFRVQTGFNYRYSTILASPNKSVTVPYSIKNTADQSKGVRLTLSGIDATFISNGNDQITFPNLAPGESKDLRIRVDPQNVGRKNLEVLVENLNLDLSSRDLMDVYVRNRPATASEVPGIGFLQLLSLFLFASTLFYSGRL